MGEDARTRGLLHVFILCVKTANICCFAPPREWCNLLKRHQPADECAGPYGTHVPSVTCLRVCIVGCMHSICPHIDRKGACSQKKQRSSWSPTQAQCAAAPKTHSSPEALARAEFSRIENSYATYQTHSNERGWRMSHIRVCGVCG